MAFLDFVDPVGIFHDGNILKGLGIDPKAKSDQEQYINDLLAQLAQMQNQMPNLSQEYDAGSKNVLNSWKNPVSYSFNPMDFNNYSGEINNQFDASTKNLNRNVGTNVMNAQSSAGAQAAAGNFANPIAFVSNQGQRVRDSFVPAYGQLEEGRARALADLAQKIGFYNNQGMNQTSQMNTTAQNNSNINYTNLMKDLFSGKMGATQNDWQNKMGLFNTKAGFANFKDPYTSWDKALNFGSNILGNVAQGFGKSLSDIRFKENISYHDTVNGYNRYKFSYKGNPNKKYIGVMAQEIASSIPDAVVDRDGVLYVDYSKLGFEMQEVN